jgi:BRCT domain type II-containing protein
MALSANMGSIVLRSLSVLLGIFFIFVGVMKITSQVSKDLHKDLVRTVVYAMICKTVYAATKLQSMWIRCIPLLLL